MGGQQPARPVSVILLDTHVLLWLLGASERLGSRARERIADAQVDGGVSVPAISFWETLMLVDKGHLRIDGTIRNFTTDVLALPGIMAVPVDPLIAADAGSLPPLLHGDPCDRLIVATARALGCVLLTADENILHYAAAGHLRAEDARL